MKYKKTDFPSIETVDEKEFEISGTLLESYDGERETIFVPYGVTEIAESAFQNKEYNTYDDEDESRGSEYLEYDYGRIQGVIKRSIKYKDNTEIEWKFLLSR